MQTKMKTPSHIRLHAGGGIRFGFMRQNNLSGRTLSVTDVSSYIFDHDSFASYQLRDEDTDVSIILAEAENTQDAYMAISLALKDRWFASLFSALPPREWLRLAPGDKVKVAHESVVMPQGWLVSEYKHVLTTRGSKLSGDFRKRMNELAEFYSDMFDYILLVSDEGEHAIELERYENGTLKIYATVYRPMTDISETTPYQRPYIVAKNTPQEPAKPHEDIPVSNEAPAAVGEEDTSTLLLTTPLAEEAPTAPKEEKVPPYAGQEEATRLPAPTDASPPQSMLACDAKLAARVIDEAIRNKLSLADIIRKVIDLPKELSDTVYIPFELSESEQTTLARRYGLAEHDCRAVQEKIVEELSQFAGVK